MSLRRTLLLLSFLALFSAITGGSFYYSSLKDAAYREADRQAVMRVRMIQKNLSSFLAENIKPVRTLAIMPEVIVSLESGDFSDIQSTNNVLDRFKQTLAVDVCYLITWDGLTIASSNRASTNSFVGQNFNFRPYYKEAISGFPSTYLALGTTSGERGVYNSYPVYGQNDQKIIGVAVIKSSIDLIEHKLSLSGDEVVMLVDPYGVIFISNKEDWLFKLYRKSGEQNLQQIRESRQFGAGPWQWTGLTEQIDDVVTDPFGNKYLVHQVGLENYPGWQVILLRDFKEINKFLSTLSIRATRPVIIALCLLVALMVAYLYKKSSDEIQSRKEAEEALTFSEKRYRSLYNKTPAMLHSIDKDGILLSVSDYWLKDLGYAVEEVVGRKVTDFYTEQSRKYAEETVIPEFFINGCCADVPYQFVKKDGQIIDVLLSAISEKDNDGNIIRSLAISVDVTERNRAEQALQAAKEKLSLYSKDLEEQVRERTLEINSILTNTPDVVYVKDKQGRFKMINKRFEEIVGISNAQILGKTDFEIFEKTYAKQFVENDQKVFATGMAIQVEEDLPQCDEIHTYLSVKFPIFTKEGVIGQVCSIATDITALNRAKAQLRNLSGAIMESQEKERKALSRELHDELGQVLTALRLEATGLQERTKTINSDVSSRAARMCSLIDNTIDEVRGMAYRLRPGVLDDLGLVDALESHASEFERRTGISCFFEQHNVPEIGSEVATAAYRITQEALTNVVRHSGASHVEIVLGVENDMFTLSVVDQGVGFEADDSEIAEGFGLVGMRERAVLVGGNLTVDSTPKKGTVIMFTVPLV